MKCFDCSIGDLSVLLEYIDFSQFSAPLQEGTARYHSEGAKSPSADQGGPSPPFPPPMCACIVTPPVYKYVVWFSQIKVILIKQIIKISIEVYTVCIEQ